MMVAFLAGMMAGALLGVLMMCLLMVASDTDDWEDA